MLHANPEMFADVYRVVARLLIVKSMSKLFGFILLFGGSIMLYFGWQAHEAALASSIGTVPRATGSESVWLLIGWPTSLEIYVRDSNNSTHRQ